MRGGIYVKGPAPGAEERFDRITRLAHRVFGASMSAFPLVDSDRQWFKPKVGPQGEEDTLE